MLQFLFDNCSLLLTASSLLLKLLSLFDNGSLLVDDDDDNDCLSSLAISFALRIRTVRNISSVSKSTIESISSGNNISGVLLSFSLTIK